MLIFLKIYIWHKKGKLLLLACGVATILCLYTLIGFLEDAMTKQLVVRETGAIPSFAIYFKTPVPSSKVDEVFEAIRSSLPLSHLRKGYKFTNDVSFSWNKGGRNVSTTLNVTHIGWEMNYPIELRVRHEHGTAVIRCLAMHPVDGFLVPKSDAESLGRKILVVSARIKGWKTFTQNLNLPAILRKGYKRVGSVVCASYSFPKPSHYPLSKAESVAYKKLRDRYYSVISHSLGLPLGDSIWKSLHADSKNNLFRLYHYYHGPAAGIPSCQLWQDICGASYQRLSRYKRFDIEEENGSKVLRYELEFWGYCLTHYRSELNPHYIMCNYDWLIGRFGMQKRAYNLIEIDMPFSKATGHYMQRVTNILGGMGFSPGSYKVIPWWDMANEGSVKFLNRIRVYLAWFRWVVLVLAGFAFYQILSRFTQATLSVWKMLRPFGFRTRHLVGASVLHSLFYTLLGFSAAYGFSVALDRWMVAPLTFMTFLEASGEIKLREILLGGWWILLGIFGMHVFTLVHGRRQEEW